MITNPPRQRRANTTLESISLADDAFADDALSSLVQTFIMNQQPWTSSTRSDATNDQIVEVRFPPALLSVITLALIFGGILTCGLMWFLSGQQPASEQNTLRAIGTVVLLVDIGAAIFLRSFLGNSFVRADDQGVTRRAGFGAEQFVSWDNIARVETQQSAGIVSGFTLFDASNNAIMKVRPESRPPLDKAKLVAFIGKKLGQRR